MFKRAKFFWGCCGALICCSVALFSPVVDADAPGQSVNSLTAIDRTSTPESPAEAPARRTRTSRRRSGPRFKT